MRYNKKVWTFVDREDSPDDTLFGIYDAKDGSSFLIRMEFIQGASGVEDEEIEKALKKSLHNSDEEVLVKNRFYIDIKGKVFRAVDYEFHNEKYGLQRIRHAFLKKQDHILILASSWPEKETIPLGAKFPTKHLSLIEGLTL